jgi:hypothetical protein
MCFRRAVACAGCQVQVGWVTFTLMHCEIKISLDTSMSHEEMPNLAASRNDQLVVLHSKVDAVLRAALHLSGNAAKSPCVCKNVMRSSKW